MSEPGKAVFLSYASQDAEPARRICEALRAAGVEVWFDQSELRGGDSWDQKIRRQIKECALFVPVISQHTQARLEGYFRREWKLAVDRTHDMADHVAFLVPVVLDGTSDREAHVPEKFREVQWTRLPGGETPPAFCARVRRLLGEDGPTGGTQATAPAVGGQTTPPRPSRRTWFVAAVAGLVVLGAVGLWQPWEKAPTPEGPAGGAKAAPSESEARKLERQARALIDDDPLAVRENFRTANELCQRAVTLSPDDGEIWATMARADCQLNLEYSERSDRQVAAARSEAERAIRLAPHSIESGLAMTSFELVNRVPAESVIRRLEALLQVAPDDRRILRLLVRLGADDHGIGSARRWADRANALPGGDAPALANLAWVYWALNQFPELKTVLDRSLAIQRTSSACHLKLMVLMSCGELTAAREWLDQIPPAILREDRVASVAFETFYYSRQPELALEVLSRIPREILEEGRYFAPRSYLAGEALLMAGKPHAAEVEFRAALKVIDERLASDPRNGLVAMWKGRIMARLGNREEAMRLFEVWRELRSDISIYDPENYLLVGQPDEAIAAADKVLDHSRSRWPSAYRRLKSNPIYDQLQGNPRFEQILARGERWFVDMMGKPSPADAPAKVDEKSVAVLAFANLSDDKANEYFSDGITEELLNVLAKVPGLKVTARTSSFHFKGKDTAIPEIARQLGVAYVVEGSVRKAGDKVRITAQLIKAADGFHAWSDTFTRELKDIFAVQDEIAALIAQNLQLKLEGASRTAPTANPEAHQLYLQGRFFLNQLSLDSTKRATELLQHAVELDPGFAPAWAALSRAGTQRGGYGNTREDVEAGFALARRAANRALELDPNLAAAHLALSQVQIEHDYDWKRGAESLRRAQALAPTDGAVVDGAAQLAYALGQTEQAAELARQAVELDPVNPEVRILNGFALTAVRRFAEAEPEFRKVIELNPAAPWGHAGVSGVFLAQGRFDEAVAEAEKEGNEWSHLYALAGARWGQQRKPEADAALQQLIASYGDVAAFQVADVYAYRGEPDQAFEWLERAYRQHDSGLAWSKSDLTFEGLHADPRWAAFMRKLGLAEDQLK